MRSFKNFSIRCNLSVCSLIYMLWKSSIFRGIPITLITSTPIFNVVWSNLINTTKSSRHFAITICSNVFNKFGVSFRKCDFLMIAYIPVDVMILPATVVIGYLIEHIQNVSHHLGFTHIYSIYLIAFEMIT